MPADPHLEGGTCECCGGEPAVQIAAVPGVGVSIAWGARCLNAEILPYWCVIAGTFTGGGSLDDCDDWWIELVESSLIFHNKSRRDLAIDLAKAEANENAYFASLEDHDGAGEDDVVLDNAWGAEEAAAGRMSD